MNKTEIPRRFRQIKPEPLIEDRVISDFYERNIFVILGEPGLGKTTCFKSSAKNEPHSLFVRLGEFLSSQNLEAYNDKVLYLDGLDEHRSKSHGKNVIDEIVGRLRKLNFPKVRISCRTAEWLGDQDINALRAASKDQDLTQLELLPLTQDEYKLLLPEDADYEDFIKGAKQNGLDGFLKNPQDFIFLWEQFSRKNRWPKNRRELMEEAIKLLIKENNPVHSSAVDDFIKEKDLINAANYLSAIFMLSGISGINIQRPSSNETFPIIHEFDGDLPSMKAAASRRIFKHITGMVIEPEHRKISEFMAAGYLAEQVRQGLPLRRVIALLTGIDGGVAPDLRGTFAWFVTLLSGRAEEILVHDPYGAILYGEPRSWTPMTKLCALEALNNLAKKDPWFRGSDWFRADIAGLSDDKLSDAYKAYLAKDNCQSHFIGVILEALAKGGAIPDLGNDLINFIKSNKPNHLRSMAIDAFWKTCPARREDLLEILDQINARTIQDDNQSLRGVLLENLYPEYITPKRIADYLIKPASHMIGQYYMFFKSGLIKRTDINGCKEIFSEIDKIIDQDFEGEEYIRDGLITSLISKLFQDENATYKDRFKWLVKGLDIHGISRLRSEENLPITQYISDHEDEYFLLFVEFYDSISGEPKRHSHYYAAKFQQLTLYVSPPANFVSKLLAAANNEPDEKKSIVFFGVASYLYFHSGIEFSNISIEHFESAVKLKSIFEQEFTNNSASSLENHEWRRDHKNRELQKIEKKRQRKAQNITYFNDRKKSIAEGKELEILEFAAKVWVGAFVDSDRDLPPGSRLRDEVGEELSECILSGFRKILEQSKYFNTIAEIAEADVQNQGYSRSYLLRASIEALTNNYEDCSVLSEIPEEVFKRFLAYQIARENLSQNLIIWMEEYLGGAVKATLLEYWETQINKKAKRLSAFHYFIEPSFSQKIISETVYYLLEKYPKADDNILKELLALSLRNLNTQQLSSLVETALTNKFSTTNDNRALWISVGFYINSEKYKQRIKSIIKTDKKWVVKDILMTDILKRDENGFVRPLSERIKIIEVLCPAFKNIPLTFGSGWRGTRDEESAAQDIKSLIHSLSAESTDDATIALNQLLESNLFNQWHSDIQITLANHIRLKRQVKFKYPDVVDVISTLSNAEPANVTDLKALVMDALHQIQASIKNSNTDKYKAFWVTESQYGKVKQGEHIGENEARNRIIDELRSILAHLDITIEPEALYVEGNRADIAIYCKGMKLPIEIKRDDHREIWKAAEQQLAKQYTRDPASEGNGIYLVIWFDGHKMKAPPTHLSMGSIKNSNDLKAALNLTIPEVVSGLIDVMVLDVEPPQKDYEKKIGSTKD